MLVYSLGFPRGLVCLSVYLEDNIGFADSKFGTMWKVASYCAQLISLGIDFLIMGEWNMA